MNRWQNFYLIRKWPDEAGKANNQFAESAGPETYAAKLTKLQYWVPTYNELQQAHFFSAQKRTLLIDINESSTKHHFHGHIFMKWTRMHSSRMRTICCSDRGGCVCLGGSAQGGVSAQGVVFPGRVSARGLSAGGVCLGVSAGGGWIPACTDQTAPPPGQNSWQHLSKHYLSATTLINCSSKVPSVHSNNCKLKLYSAIFIVSYFL